MKSSSNGLSVVLTADIKHQLWEIIPHMWMIITVLWALTWLSLLISFFGGFLKSLCEAEELPAVRWKYPSANENHTLTYESVFAQRSKCNTSRRGPIFSVWQNQLREYHSTVYSRGHQLYLSDWTDIMGVRGSNKMK